jgi:hypothetical protein
MKKNTWKLVGIIVLVAVIGFGLAGCGNKGDPGSPGGGHVVIIKNSATAKIIGIYITDASTGGDDIVGTDDEFEAVVIGPGATYTSPEINCEYISLYVQMDSPAPNGISLAQGLAIEPGDFEVVIDDDGDYVLEER